MKKRTNFQNVTREKRHQSITGNVSDAEMAINTLQTWLDIANRFEALRPGPRALEKPDAIAMQRFVLEMRDVLSHDPRLRAWVTDTNRQGRFYEVAHIARNILVKAAQWHRELGHNYLLTRVPPIPSSLTVMVDRVG